MVYYIAILLLTWMSLGVLSVLVHENDRMSTRKRRLCYFTYAIIAMASAAEMCSVLLADLPGTSAWAIYMTKWADYTLTPLVGGAVVAQMGLRNKWDKVLNGILLANVAFQTIGFAGGWMITVDAHNHYEHASLYVVYAVIYLAVIAIVVAQFISYGKSFRRQNRGSLYAIMTLVITGIALQEVLDDPVRVAYLSLTLGVMLLFIHNAEFFQLKQDKSMADQRAQLMTDTLTGALSRYAYSADLKTLAAEDIPHDLAVFSIDVNSLKEVNDTCGHEAGDELIRDAATCIQSVFGLMGRTYRTGGDEFVVLATTDRERADQTLAELERNARAWEGELVSHMTLACGYALACDYPELSPEKLVAQADKSMYAAKYAYYKHSGKDRRRTWGDPRGMGLLNASR